MGEMTRNGEKFSVLGKFLQEGFLMPDFLLLDGDLSSISLDHFSSRIKCFFTVPSVDTSICERSVKMFNDLAVSFSTIDFILVSRDTPHAQQRFCTQKEVNNIKHLSDMKTRSQLGKDWGVLITEGPLDGFFARSVIVLNEKDQVTHSEFVSEITELPNFALLRAHLKELINPSEG